MSSFEQRQALAWAQSAASVRESVRSILPAPSSLTQDAGGNWTAVWELAACPPHVAPERYADEIRVSLFLGSPDITDHRIVDPEFAGGDYHVRVQFHLRREGEPYRTGNWCDCGAWFLVFESLEDHWQTWGHRWQSRGRIERDER